MIVGSCSGLYRLDYCTQVAIKLGFKKIIVTVLIRAIEDGLKLGLDADSIKKEAFDAWESNQRLFHLASNS